MWLGWCPFHHPTSGRILPLESLPHMVVVDLNVDVRASKANDHQQ